MNVKFTFDYIETDKCIEIIFENFDVNDTIQKKIFVSKNFYEIELLTALKSLTNLCQDVTFIDIGANIGNHSIYFGKVLNSKVFSFEPFEKSFNKLLKNFEANELINAKAFNIALGSKNCQGIISGNINGNNLGGLKVKNITDGNIIISKFDDIYESGEIQLSQYNIVKIDVEGAEYDVLCGAEKFLRRFRPILAIEISSDRSFVFVKKLLHEIGYVPVVQLFKTPTFILLPIESTSFNSGIVESLWYSARHYISTLVDLYKLKNEITLSN